MSLTLHELMLRDPLELTREDRAALIDYYRTQRKHFAQQEQVAKATGKPVRTKKLSDGERNAILDLDLDLS